MNIPDHIFKSYDIRGIVPDDINKDNMYTITQAILKYFQEQKGKESVEVVFARDMRESSPELSKIMLKALTDGGAHVLDIDLASTPTYYFAVMNLNADCGLILTASHNPGQYNGIKAVLNNNGSIVKIGGESGLESIKEYAKEGIVLENDGGSVKKVEGMVKEEVSGAFEGLKISPDDLHNYKVVADPANAMAGLYIEELFNRLPSELIKMNFELDGTFPAHQADPLQFETLKDLQQRVKDEGADIGIGPDGDGDRIFFIDDRGEIVPASFITGIIARELLESEPAATILYDIRYTMTPRDVIKEHGGQSDITKVGHAFITQQIHETGAIFGGESSAHYFFRDTGGAESQVRVILIVLQAMSKRKASLSQLVEEIRKSYESGEYNFKSEDTASIMEKLKETYSDGNVSEIDGVSIEFDDWRCNVRTSNTEPLMRLNVEARTSKLMNEKLSELTDFILSEGAVPHEH